ncbi:hypothetical protein PVIIG_05176, partial [Plasmodium vivax India VII]
MKRREWSVVSSGGRASSGCSACSACSIGGAGNTGGIPPRSNRLPKEKKNKRDVRGAPSITKAGCTGDSHTGRGPSLRASVKKKRGPQLARKGAPKGGQTEANQLGEAPPLRSAPKIASLATYAHKYRLTKTCSLKKGCQQKRKTSTPRGRSNCSERPNGLMEQQKCRVHYHCESPKVEGPSAGVLLLEGGGKPSRGKIKPMTKLRKKKNERLRGGCDPLSEHLEDMNGGGLPGGACPGGSILHSGSDPGDPVDPGDVPNWDELYSFFPYMYNRVESDGSRGEGTPNGGVVHSFCENPIEQICEGEKERRCIYQADLGGADMSLLPVGGEDPLNEYRTGGSSNEGDLEGGSHQLRGRDSNGDLSNDYITYKQYVEKSGSNGRSRLEGGLTNGGGNSGAARFTHGGYCSDGEGGGRGAAITEDADRRRNMSVNLRGHLREPPWGDLNGEGVPPAHEMQSERMQRRTDELDANSKRETHHACTASSNHLRSHSYADELDDVHSNFADSFSIKHLPEVPNDVAMVCSSDDASTGEEQHACRSSLTGELAMDGG